MQNIQLPTAEEQMLPTFSYMKNGTRYITQEILISNKGLK
jgi:hypothetical protein